MLTETDFLCRLQAGTFLELLLRMVEDSCELSHRCHETPVREAMTAPAVTVRPEAGFREMMDAFRRTRAGACRWPPQGRLRGLLLRKDFLEASTGSAPVSLADYLRKMAAPRAAARRG